jgi:hypothetical protein
MMRLFIGFKQGLKGIADYRYLLVQVTKRAGEKLIREG